MLRSVLFCRAFPLSVKHALAQECARPNQNLTECPKGALRSHVLSCRLESDQKDLAFHEESLKKVVHSEVWRDSTDWKGWSCPLDRWYSASSSEWAVCSEVFSALAWWGKLGGFSLRIAGPLRFGVEPSWSRCEPWASGNTNCLQLLTVPTHCEHFESIWVMRCVAGVQLQKRNELEECVGNFDFAKRIEK